MVGKWVYDEEVDRYFSMDHPPLGLTWAEVQGLEDGVEEHEERKRRRIPGRNEY